MSDSSLLLLIISYFGLLLLISYITGRKTDSNAAFFLGNRKSPWPVVAFGMIGTSISGVTFVSVPGMVRGVGFTYMQMVFGFFVGYIIIAQVLLPIYYKLQLVSIYTYLQKRFGRYSYKTGAFFFLLSRAIGTAARVYVVVLLIHTFVLSQWHISFEATVCGVLFLIWLYTFKSGVKTIIWTDMLQSFFLLTALILIVVQVTKQLQLPSSELLSFLKTSDDTRILVFDDWHSKQYFFKQFLSGILIPIAMTGLDQDMMQKNLSCRNLKEAQKNMYTYGFLFIPINLLFLTLGALLLLLAKKEHIPLPEEPDAILPLFATAYLGTSVTVFFFIGILSATFASADSALTALTTSFSIDILNIETKKPNVAKHIRRVVHVFMSVVIVAIILMIHWLGNTKGALDIIYSIASYTYGPLLGLFAFGIFTKKNIDDRRVPFIALLSPVLIAVLDEGFNRFLNYQFGYELLLINGLLTFAGLWFISKKQTIITNHS